MLSSILHPLWYLPARCPYPEASGGSHRPGQNSFFSRLLSCGDQLLHLAVQHLCLALGDDSKNIRKLCDGSCQQLHISLAALPSFAVLLASFTSSKIAETASAVLKSSSIAASEFCDQLIHALLVLLLCLSQRVAGHLAHKLF